MSMKLEPKVCPKCGKPFRSIPQTVSAYSELSFDEETGTYDWSGDTDYEGHVDERDAQGRILAECMGGHFVPVVDLEVPEAQRLAPPPKKKKTVWVMPCIYGGVVTEEVLLFESEEAVKTKRAALCEENGVPREEDGSWGWNEGKDIGFPIWKKTIPDPDANADVHSVSTEE